MSPGNPVCLFEGQKTEWKGGCVCTHVCVCACVCVLGSARALGLVYPELSALHRKEHCMGSLEVWFAG